MSNNIARRKLIAALGGLVASGPRAVRAQEQARPIVAVVNGRSADSSLAYVAAFRQGLKEKGYVEDQNVIVEYHWLDGQYGRLHSLMADLVRRQVAVIATPGSNPAAIAAKDATKTIPIVFAVGEDPVRLGLVASFAQPGGNATGVNFFGQEVVTKALGLLHRFVPKAARIAVLANSANRTVSDVTIRTIQEAAPALGLTVKILYATTAGEIDAAFATFTNDRPDALFVVPDGFFSSRVRQFAALAAREKIPAAYWNREFVAAGGLMSYGTDLADAYRQVGAYTGQILKGAKPAELAVIQPNKFVFAINLQTAKTLGIEVPPDVYFSATDKIQ